MTILIGPNNEGKSNILRAMVIVLNIVASLSLASVHRGRLRGRVFRNSFEWENDFPVSLQTKQPEGESVFNLNFELTDAEITEFRDEVGSKIDGDLPITITIGKKEPGFKVLKRGPGGAALSKKSAAIAQFIGKRFEFLYIPTVRTADVSENVVAQMVEKELSSIERDPAYKDALLAVSRQYEPVLTRLSSAVTDTLRDFLPNIKNVDVRMSEEATYRALRKSFEIIVDDGTPTSLHQKGDGVQSLAALGVLRHASERESSGRSVVLAIEEPESHLHPRAIHRLKDVLQNLSTKNQIILTTHCPLFVNRGDIESNILVRGNKAVAAKSTKEIREILGVRASDNLRNAELVLLVEGEDDKLAFAAILAHLSHKLRDAFSDNVLAIDTLMGASHLPFKLAHMRDTLCTSHSFLDNDDAGRKAFAAAKAESLITEAEATFTVCEGKADSEAEDLYSTDLYEGMILNKYNVSLASPKFKGNKKWSVRMRDTFAHQGKLWNSSESEVKKEIAVLASKAPNLALNPHRKSSVEALVATLERLLDTIKPSSI